MAEFKPDTGWSWVVLVAGFISAVIFDGIIFSFGIFLSELAEYFQEGLGQTAWIGSTIGAVYALVGPLASVLVNRFGCRVVTISGGLLSSAGFILSTFSHSIWMMVVTYGIMGGIGFGMMYHCAYVMIGHYFEKRRALATGIVACGSGVGTFIFAQVGDVMLYAYGWKGSMWIMAGLILQGIVLGCLYRPVPGMGMVRNDRGEEKRKLMSLSLLKSPTFFTFCFSSFLCLLGMMVPFIYLPDFAKYYGVDHSKASLLVSIIGITNTIGRIICGYVCDKSWADPLKIYNGALILAGSATVVCAWMPWYPLQATYAGVFGLCIACYVSLCAIIIIEFMGLERLSSAFGFLNMFRGIATIIGTPLAGKLYDVTGRFDLAFYVAGSCMATAGLICLPLRALSQCVKPSSNIPTEDESQRCFQNLQDLKDLEKNGSTQKDGYSKFPISHEIDVDIDVTKVAI